MEKTSPLNISLNSFFVFHEVAKYKSFSRAAEELFVSQPAVSKHIKQLEQKIGLGLIRRGRGKFDLTETGEILFKHTHKICSHLLEIGNALSTLKKDHHGVLKIGTTESYSKCLMPKLLSGFQTSHPSIKITLEVGNSEEIQKSLLDYKNDLGLIGLVKASSRFESVPFLREELIIIVSPKHPLGKRKTVSLKEIEGYPFIIRAKGSTTRRILFQAFEELDIHPSLLIEAGSSEFIKQWVSEGEGVSVIVKRLGEDEERRGMIKMIPLLEKLYFEVAVLYLKEERANPAIKAFIRYMENKRRDFSQA
jgi:DNA-binding transcriptional LysR family regulator